MSIFFEEVVESSWIHDITFDPDNDDIILTLLSGAVYRVHDADEDLFDNWLFADSQGKFWHRMIRGQHLVTRIKRGRKIRKRKKKVTRRTVRSTASAKPSKTIKAAKKKPTKKRRVYT